MQTNGVIFLLTALPLSLLTLSGAAQDLPTDGIFQTALAMTTQNCEGLRRNEACYGHALLTAAPHPGVDAFNFDGEGDIARLGAIQSIKLSGLNSESGTWGVALMQLRANLPSSQPENVTLVAFGDVEITNAVKPPTQANVQVRTRENVNVRYYPSLQARVIGTLESNETVTALERLEDSSWLRVQMPDTGETGWVFNELMTIIDDINVLNVSQSPTTYFEPMQAFYFRSGSDNAELTSVPDSGLLIQTPEGVGEVQLLINEINIQLGSTVFFQAEPDGMMNISTLEGHADVSVGDVEQTAFDGTTVSVPVDANLSPKGPPAPPKPYDEDKMKILPLDSLMRKVSAAPARTEAEITQLIEEQAAADSDSGDVLPEATTEPIAEEVAPEATLEITPEVVPSQEATPAGEITPEVIPTESVSEGTPEVQPTEASESGGESDNEDAAEATSEAQPTDAAEIEGASSGGGDAGGDTVAEGTPEAESS